MADAGGTDGVGELLGAWALVNGDRQEPARSVRRHDVDAAEKTLPVDTMIQSAVDSAVVEPLSFPVLKS